MGFSKKNNEEKKWWVYKITNPNGRIYIGVTSNLRARINHYKKPSNKTQFLIIRSIKKYGWDAHSFDILDEMFCNTSNPLSKEIFWIRSHMSNFTKYPEMKGMNLTDGGEGALGYNPSEEVRKAISIRNKGYRHTEEAKRKIGEDAKVNLLGRKLSEKTKEKLRQVNLGKKYSEETKKKLSNLREGKAINRVFTKEEKEYLSKLRKGGTHTEEAKLKISAASKNNKYKLGRPICQISLEGVEVNRFKSISEACRFLNLSKTDLSRTLKKQKINKFTQCYFKYI